MDKHDLTRKIAATALTVVVLAAILTGAVYLLLISSVFSPLIKWLMIGCCAILAFAVIGLLRSKLAEIRALRLCLRDRIVPVQSVTEPKAETAKRPKMAESKKASRAPKPVIDAAPAKAAAPVQAAKEAKPAKETKPVSPAKDAKPAKEAKMTRKEVKAAKKAESAEAATMQAVQAVEAAVPFISVPVTADVPTPVESPAVVSALTNTPVENKWVVQSTAVFSSADNTESSTPVEPAHTPAPIAWPSRGPSPKEQIAMERAARIAAEAARIAAEQAAAEAARIAAEQAAAAEAARIAAEQAAAAEAARIAAEQAAAAEAAHVAAEQAAEESTHAPADEIVETSSAEESISVDAVSDSAWTISEASFAENAHAADEKTQPDAQTAPEQVSADNDTAQDIVSAPQAPVSPPVKPTASAPFAWLNEQRSSFVSSQGNALPRKPQKLGDYAAQHQSNGTKPDENK